MKAEYDLSRLKSRKNPYASKLKKPVTMRLGEDIIGYFKGMAAEAGVPYQSLINLYLRDCVAQHRRVDISYQPPVIKGMKTTSLSVESGSCQASWCRSPSMAIIIDARTCSPSPGWRVSSSANRARTLGASISK